MSTANKRGHKLLIQACSCILCLLIHETVTGDEGTFTIIKDEGGIFFQTDKDGTWAIPADDHRFFRIGEIGTYAICSDSYGTYIKTNKQKKFYIDGVNGSNLDEEIENFNREKLRRQKTNKETRVRIIGNSILVPVKLAYKNRELSTLLLLDTGASITTINQEIADQLKLKTGKMLPFRLADGRVIQAGLVDFSYIQVGPVKKNDLQVAVVEYNGPTGPQKGLLGINFLKGLDYRIDFDRQVIQWNP